LVTANKYWAGLRKTILKPSNIPALIALIIAIAGAVFAEQQTVSAYQKDQRAQVKDDIGFIRNRLESNIVSNMQLVRGLVAAISSEPDMDQKRFADLASRLLNGETQLRNIAAAPNLIITMIYPVKGNEKAIGLDYRSTKNQSEAALRARVTGESVLAGPVDLVQGGQGFIARFPVFLDNKVRAENFWGIVSAVIDTDLLYRDSGLGNPLPIQIAIVGRDGMGARGELFYGDKSVFRKNPVFTDVLLPHGSWRIAAIPNGGWSATPDNIWISRAVSLLAIIFLVVPIVVAGWLVGDRNERMAELKTSESKLKRLSRRLELALSTSQIGVWELDVTNNKLYWDRRMRLHYGAPSDGEVEYADWRDRLHPDDLKRAVTDFEQAMAQRKPYNSQFRVLLENGDVRYIRTIGSVNEDEDGIVRILGVNWDITADVKINKLLREAKKQTELRNAELEATRVRIEHNALHDSLTGLPNRRYLDEVLSGNSDLEARHGFALGSDPNYGLLHIDLDRFKQINDTLGHAAGDAMLVHAAHVLHSNVRATDFVARIGGDEFVVVCCWDADELYLETLATRIVAEMRQPVILNKRECRCSISVGIAAGSTAPDDPKQILINADIALYRAKSEGRNGFQFFSKDLHLAAINTKRVADEILTGIEQNQFIAHYQGQFDAKTLEISGVEALARWQHPERGLLAPDSFLEIAEDLNVMATIDRIVLEHSLRQMKRWKRARVYVPRISVNVSARRLNEEDLVDSLKKLKIKPGILTFELLESTFLDESSDLVTWNIDQIKELGIDIEIDDFGTGYASIVSLMQLRPKRLKIDRLLVSPTIGSTTQRELVRSIVEIGASLDIASVAEGIETMEHAEILRDLGCQTLQGFALARPMSGRQFIQFARKNKFQPSQAA